MPDRARLTNSETGDRYRGVITRAGRHRVSRCRDGRQLLVQRRTSKAPDAGKWPWLTIAYVFPASALPGVLQRPSLGIPRESQKRLLDGLADVIASANAGCGGETEGEADTNAPDGNLVEADSADVSPDADGVAA